MVLHRAHTMKPEQNHFTCRTYKKDGAEVCSAHYIREVALKEIVLETIRRATEFARSDPERFAAYIQQKQSTEVAKEIRGVGTGIVHDAETGWRTGCSVQADV